MKSKGVAKAKSTDDMRTEYDFSKAVPNKYARALKEQGYTIRVYEQDGTFTETRVLGDKTVVLEPDVWEYFQDSKAVNHALRTLISIVPEKLKGARQGEGNGKRRAR